MTLLRRKRRGHRLLFATDLHGSEIVFRKFLSAVRVYEAQVAILGGDLTGKRIVPVVERAGGHVASVGGAEEEARSDEELDALLERIRNLGQYPLLVSQAEHDALAANRAAVDDAFEQACHAQVSDWMARAAERLEPLGVGLYVTGGNDDFFSIEPILERAPYVVNAEGRVVEIADGVEMLSSGYGNPTPWRCPRDVSEEELAERIGRMQEHLSTPARAVFNLHVPPFGSGLDTCPRLDVSTHPPRPLIGEEAPAGSHAVRRAIEQARPMLSLHGHIHESPGIQRIGPTTCVNPGSEYAEGVLRSAVVDLDAEGELLSAQLLTA